MIVYMLVALIYIRPFFEKPDSGVIQIEFNTIAKCESAKKVIDDKFNVSKIECLEIKK